MYKTWLTFSELLKIELYQLRDEGFNIEGYEEKIEKVLDIKDEKIREREADALLESMVDLPRILNYPYYEPTVLSEILEGFTSQNIAEGTSLNTAEIVSKQNDELSDRSFDNTHDGLYDKILGAWVGRCAGCMLGKPFEGSTREEIRGYYSDIGKYPVNSYFIADPKYLDKYGLRRREGLSIEKIKFLPEDDDLNYTVLGLKIIERYGKEFTSENVGESWLRNLPLFHVCTAERVAYRNISNLILPPDSARHRNPYREWIGAQIRADIYGYINPGNPLEAAKMAWRDASVSHVKNGIYGSMFVAAMLAASYTKNNIPDIIDTGLSVIPKNSRLYLNILQVKEWYDKGYSYEDCIEKLHMQWDESNSYDWCHVISNAMIVCLGILYGELDFGKSISVGLMCGFDTDCNCATIGSIIGLVNGFEGIPEYWHRPINDTLQTGISGLNMLKLSELANKTKELI